MQVYVTLDITFQTHLRRSRLPTRTMNMDARLDQEEMGQANNKFWTKSRPITPSELRLYRHAQDHRLLSRDILGYPSLFGNMLAQPLISKVIPFSGGLQRSHETCRRSEAARRGDE